MCLLFNRVLYRGPTAEATQGLTRSVYKSFATRGEAIVAYQVMLLRGKVFLVNKKEVEKVEEE